MKKTFLIIIFLLLPTVAMSTTWSTYSTGTSYGTNGVAWAIQDGGTVIGCVQGSITSDIFHAMPGADIAVHRSNTDCTGTNNGQVGSSALGNDDYDFYIYHSGSTVKLYYSTDYVADADGDGVNDDVDLCASTPAGSTVDSDGCTFDQLYCHNEILDTSEGETGLDCGGDCLAECLATCPEGSYFNDPNFDGFGDCVEEIETDNYGNCPDLVNWFYYDGYTDNDGDYVPAMCSRVFDPVYSAVAPDLPPTEEAWTYTSGTVSDSTFMTIDNLDGTTSEAETFTTTTTNTDGSTTTEVKTVTVLYNTATTEKISSTTVIDNITSDGNAAGEAASYIAASNKDAAETVADSIDGLTETVSDTFIDDVMTSMDDSKTSSDGDADSAIQARLEGIESDYGDGSSFPVSQTVTSTIEAQLPSYAECSDLEAFTMDGTTMLIPCLYFDKIKELLGFALYFLTAFVLLNTLASTAPKP